MFFKLIFDWKISIRHFDFLGLKIKSFDCNQKAMLRDHRPSFCDYGIREFGRICLRWRHVQIQHQAFKIWWVILGSRLSMNNVSFDVPPTLNHRNWRKALCKERGDHRYYASTPSHSSADLPRIGLLTKLPCLAFVASMSSVANRAVLKWSSWDFPATPGFHPKRWQIIPRNQ